MDLIIYTLRSLSYIVVEPSLILILIVVSIFFYLKNRKIAILQKITMGERISSPLELTLSQIVLGMLLGILGSLILSSLGIVFKEDSGIIYLLLISMLLMFIKPRLVCFSYSAAILGILSIILTYILPYFGLKNNILEIDILSLMTFVAVMHILEGIIVMFDGDKGAIPIFSSKGNKIMGGFALSRYWILPLAIFIAFPMQSGSSYSAETIMTPNWWPIIKSNYIINIIEISLLSATPFFGVIGYSSVTFTKRKKQKAVSSGIYIITFGILLGIVAQLGRIGLVGEIVTIIFAPVAHEFMLYIQRKKEDKDKSIYISDDNGIAILDIIPYSEIANLGIKSGDKIVKVNNEFVETEKDVYAIAKKDIDIIELDILTLEGENKKIKLHNEEKKGLCALLVPRTVNTEKAIPFKQESFSEVLHKMDSKSDRSHK